MTNKLKLKDINTHLHVELHIRLYKVNTNLEIPMICIQEFRIRPKLFQTKMKTVYIKIKETVLKVILQVCDVQIPVELWQVFTC